MQFHLLWLDVYKRQNKDTIDMASGADMVVSGSYVCESTDYEKAIESLKN